MARKRDHIAARAPQAPEAGTETVKVGHRARPEDDRGWSRRFRPSPAVMVMHRERQALTIEGPTGPIEVVYGVESHGTKATDSFGCRHRGQNLTASTLDSLLRQVNLAEEAWQAKDRRDKMRRETMAKPLPAVLVPRLSAGRLTSVPPLDGAVERVHVRGIDLRSNDVLVVRANGDKESQGRTLVLRDLDRDEEREVRQTLARLVEAHERLALTTGLDPMEVLAEAGVEIDLTVAVDIATGERFATHDGHEYRAASDSHLVDQVARDVAARTHPWSTRDGQPVPAREVDASWYSLALWTTREAVEQHLAAQQVVDDATAAWEALTGEYAFDLTIFEPAPPAAPTPTDTDETPAIAPTLRAPEGPGDWED